MTFSMLTVQAVDFQEDPAALAPTTPASRIGSLKSFININTTPYLVSLSDIMVEALSYDE